MNMIRHHYEGVKLVTVKFAVSMVQRDYNHLRDFRVAEEEWARGGSVQEPVDDHERLSGRCDCPWREYAIVGEAAVQSECYEQGLVDYVPVGQSAFIMAHAFSCFDGGKILAALRPAESRLRAGLPAPQSCRIGRG